MELGQALRTFSNELSGITEDAALESRLIIQKVTGLSRPVLLSHPEREISLEEEQQICLLCRKRLDGVPLPYILGKWEFYGHSFIVDPSVLIPRPETELLVETAAAWLRKHPNVQQGFDIGTGSGCIAISLLLAFPELRMTAVDLKREALHTARRNAVRLQCSSRFSPVQADLFSAFKTEARLICANLPYIPTETCRIIEPARYEPMSALDGGEDGFRLYRLLFEQLTNKMDKESLILCEIEYRQRELALTTAQRYFPGSQICVKEDLSGLPRLLIIERRTAA